MNERVTYEWSEDLGRAAFRASHAATGTRLSFLIVAGVVLSVVGWSAYISTGQPIALFAGIIGIFWLLLPLRFFFLYRQLVKDASRLVIDPTVTVLLNDDSFTIASGKDTRTIEWKRTTKVMDRNGFLIVYCGKIIAACLPKCFLSDTQVDFVKSRLKT